MRDVKAPLGRSLAAFALLTAAFSCAVLLAGCIPVVLDKSGNIESIGVPQKHPEPSKAETGTPSPSMVGATKTAGSWQVTVVRARTTSKGPGGARPGSGKTFLLVDTVFKNTKMSESLLVTPKSASLTSASGKKYAEWGTRSGYNGGGMREIGPGYGGNTTFVYRIPKGSSGYIFTYAPKVGGKRVKLEWTVP